MTITFLFLNTKYDIDKFKNREAIYTIECILERLKRIAQHINYAAPFTI